jgi:hypothetical protein
MATLEPEVLSATDSTLWRDAYLTAFVDTSCDDYKRYIAQPRQFSDGVHYEGYIWDCLRGAQQITVQRFRSEVARHDEVFVIADDHSRDRVMGPPLWPYAPYSVARFKVSAVLQSLALLPEDIYVFDESVSWTVVLTHEYDHKRRYCLAVGIDGARGNATGRRLSDG